MRVHYFREVPNETPVPFEERILHVDEHLVVADKPHFLSVMPAGEYVNETLLARLSKRLGNADLVRFTVSIASPPGWCCSRPTARAATPTRRCSRAADRQALRAICPALHGLEFPLRRQLCVVPGEAVLPDARRRRRAEQRNAIEVLERRDHLWRYALTPITGRKHQLRLHMATLGAGICNDPYYPQLLPRQERDQDDYSRPLQAPGARLALPRSAEW